jgi:hypothetical protein
MDQAYPVRPSRSHLPLVLRLKVDSLSKKVFIAADHGLAVIYFLQSDVLSTLLDAGVEVVLLTDDALVDELHARFRHPGLLVEGLRYEKATQYAIEKNPEIQWWLNFLRRVGSSNQINTEAMDSYVRQVSVEEGRKRRLLVPLARLALAVLRKNQTARRWLVGVQNRFNPGLYTDLFEKYQPDLVVASTYGWRLDRYLLREASLRSVDTAAMIVGWDNPSSYGITATRVNWVNCWSEVQKLELILGSDWPEDRIHIGGIPSYDGYFRKTWQMPREEYYRLHGLDPQRKLLAYAASFVSFAPNYPNVEALARLVTSDELDYPSQLLVRLHPNHFSSNSLFLSEREKIRQLARQLPFVHVVEPVPIGGSLGYYSGEDMPEKTSMMAHCDVFLTVYSTMVVEAAIHERPIVSVCLDTPGGWNTPHKFSLPLSQIGNWPTHCRFRQARAGRVVMNELDLKSAVNHYLANPYSECEQRRAFIQQECTFTDGSAGQRTGDFLMSILTRAKA